MATRIYCLLAFLMQSQPVLGTSNGNVVVRAKANVQDVAVPMEVIEPETIRNNWQVVGVISESEVSGRGIAVIKYKGKKSYTLRTGQILPGQNEYRITKIKSGKVYVAGKVGSLKLSQFSPPKARDDFYVESGGDEFASDDLPTFPGTNMISDTSANTLRYLDFLLKEQRNKVITSPNAGSTESLADDTSDLEVDESQDIEEADDYAEEPVEENGMHEQLTELERDSGLSDLVEDDYVSSYAGEEELE